MNLNELIGFDKESKLLIINCDDLGVSYSQTEAIRLSLEAGFATSATLMVPCPWAKYAAGALNNWDIGIHLTLNCEWDNYKWSPLTESPSLRNEDGYMYKTILEVWERANLDEVYDELNAQISLAKRWGVDPTHLDSHMGTLQLREDFFDVYLALAKDHKVPLRLSARNTQPILGFDFKDRAEKEGVLSPDVLAIIISGVGSRSTVKTTLENLSPGVTELYFHPAIPSAEQQHIGSDWTERADDFELLTNESPISDWIRSSGAQLVSYKLLRDAMRNL